jgi:hypothetical protein
MSHMPVNHRLRPVYRTLAAACGLYILVFGILGIGRTRDFGTFAQHGLPNVLGLHANRAFAILSIVVGAVLIAGSVIGRNVDRWINLVGGYVFLGAGMAMMILMQTSLNVLGFTMATCIVSFVIGLVLFSAGLYGRVGPRDLASSEDQFRHGSAPDPHEHPWATGKDTEKPVRPSSRFA